MKQTNLLNFFKVKSVKPAAESSASQPKEEEANEPNTVQKKVKKEKKPKKNTTPSFTIDKYFKVSQDQSETAIIRRERMRMALIREQQRIKEEMRLERKRIRDAKKLEKKKEEEALNQIKEEELRKQQIENDIRMRGEGVEICVNVYIGTSLTASNLKYLEDKQIQSIVNCTKSVPCFFSSKENEDFNANDYDGIKEREYLRIPIEDASNENILKYFDQVYNFVENTLKDNKAVLFHCKFGRSRSAALLTSYTMKKYKLHVNEAILLFEKRGWTVSINSSFLSQLNEYEDVIFNNNDGNVRRRKKTRNVVNAREIGHNVDEILSQVSQHSQSSSQYSQPPSQQPDNQ